MSQHDQLSHFLDVSSEVDTASLFSNVLLVEDEPAHALLLTRALKGFVGEVEHVTSAELALRALENSLPELMLCDLNLPDASGIDLLKAVREVRPGLPIIVMTASSNLEDAISAMREGAWDYMVKQFSEDLQGTVELVVRRTAERKLQQMRETQVRGERDAFWAAVHTAQNGLAIVSPQGMVVFANDTFGRFCSRLGPQVGETSHLNLVDLVAAHDFTVARDLQQKLSAHSKDSYWSTELRIDPAEDAEEQTAVYYEIALTSVKIGGIEGFSIGSSNSVPVLRRFVVWIRDISRRKEQEKFQRDLLATTTHDLKGPLSAILTSAELISDEEDYGEDRAQQLVTRIASCARNSISLIDELLSARRIQDGVMVVKPRWCNLPEVLEDMVLDYQPVAKAKDIDLTYMLVGDIDRVFADKLGLERVLGNLVNNAIKFTLSGGSISLTAEHRAKEARLSVTDTGPGIEASVLPTLFEKYTRLERHQTVQGTGLGLFVAKNIVEAHAGRIEVTSEVGVGTTFTVCLPDES